MKSVLQIYSYLPPSVRSIGASIQGARLRAWRYGANTEELVAKALERDHWSAGQWATWQKQRLHHLLHRAVTNVPYYRKFWAERRRRGDRSSWEQLENWPILEKESLRANPAAFLADDVEVRSMKQVHTSGTTGTSLDLWRSKNTEREWYALFEARCRSWHGISRHDRWAILGGQLVTPVRQRRPPFWVWNAPLKQLYMSSYHLAPDLIPHYLDALKNYRISYLLGYPSALYELALEALRSKRDLRMRVVLANAEPVFAYQRQAIEEAFQCPMRETYGMAEIAAAASECEQGRLHLWPEVAWIEVFADEGSSGDLICTGLLNADMPLIRYRVGDRVSLPDANTVCSCGRALPAFASVEGRMDDTLYTSDGRRVGRLDPAFKSELPIREAQVIQETLNRVRVRYVPAAEFNQAAARSITERLQSRLGPLEVVLERVDEVPRTSNGKFRAVVCNLPAELKESLRQAVVSERF